MGQVIISGYKPYFGAIFNGIRIETPSSQYSGYSYMVNRLQTNYCNSRYPLCYSGKLWTSTWSLIFFVYEVNFSESFAIFKIASFVDVEKLFRRYKKLFNPFHATRPILYPLKTSENLWFSDFSRRYRKRLVAWNRLRVVFDLERYFLLSNITFKRLTISIPSSFYFTHMFPK